MRAVKLPTVVLIASATILAGTTAWSASRAQDEASSMATAQGPSDQGPPLPQMLNADPALGRDTFRFETFGNEGFWTDAVRLPAGIEAAKVTPMQALALGLQIDADAIDPETAAKLMAELRADPSGRRSTVLNDPQMTGKLIMANAVMGMSPRGGKVGTSCALCHSMSDASVFKSPEGGSIGKRLDGLANHELHLGEIFATAANTRALYPVAEIRLKANMGKSLGRAPQGLSADASEAGFDAYFSNHRFYPVGMFDDSFDGNGNPMHNTPLFRQDLAAPYGSEGTFTKLEDFSNLVFTTLFDQTMLTTPGGRAFVHKLAGPAGDEMIGNYVTILAKTGVSGYPYVRAAGGGKPGELATPIGFRVDNSRLLAMNVYLAALQAPAGLVGNRESMARGKALFASSGCTGCHNTSQGRAVPTTLHAMARIFPGDRPKLLAPRMPPLNPVLDTPGTFFDDKMAVVNASLRGEKRGVAMPLLLDLARKPTFLHDDSVRGLEALFDPARGRSAPHPFYLRDAGQRRDMAAHLRALDAGSE